MVKIHGKEYVEVKDRVAAFHNDHPNGAIETLILPAPEGRARMRAVVTPDVKNPTRLFTGHAEEREGSTQINRTSYLENCETSAIGRALAAAGYGIEASYASANEVTNANAARNSTEIKREADALIGALRKTDSAEALDEWARERGDVINAMDGESARVTDAGKAHRAWLDLREVKTPQQYSSWVSRYDKSLGRFIDAWDNQRIKKAQQSKQIEVTE